MKKLILVGILIIFLMPSAAALSCSFTVEQEGMNLQLTPTISADTCQYMWIFSNLNGTHETTQWIPASERNVLSRVTPGGHYIIYLRVRNLTTGNEFTTSESISLGNYPEEDPITLTITEDEAEPTIFQNFFNPIFDWLGQRDRGQILFILLIAIIILWHSLFRGKEKKKVKIYNVRKVL